MVNSDHAFSISKEVNQQSSNPSYHSYLQHQFTSVLCG
jgi:hypothetical protein